MLLFIREWTPLTFPDRKIFRKGRQQAFKKRQNAPDSVFCRFCITDILPLQRVSLETAILQYFSGVVLDPLFQFQVKLELFFLKSLESSSSIIHICHFQICQHRLCCRKERDTYLSFFLFLLLLFFLLFPGSTDFLYFDKSSGRQSLKDHRKPGTSYIVKIRQLTPGGLTRSLCQIGKKTQFIKGKIMF